MDLGLHAKVAVVAAASKGLGRAVAEELAREGASVVICARGADALEQARAEIVDGTGADARERGGARGHHRELRAPRVYAHGARRAAELGDGVARGTRARGGA